MVAVTIVTLVKVVMEVLVVTVKVITQQLQMELVVLAGEVKKLETLVTYTKVIPEL